MEFDPGDGSGGGRFPALVLSGQLIVLDAFHEGQETLLGILESLVQVCEVLPEGPLMLYNLFQTLKVVLIHLILRFRDHHHKIRLATITCIVGLLLITTFDDYFMLLEEGILALNRELKAPDQLRNLLNISSFEIFSHCIESHSIDLG